jgi:hypothetical protein
MLEALNTTPVFYQPVLLSLRTSYCFRSRNLCFDQKADNRDTVTYCKDILSIHRSPLHPLHTSQLLSHGQTEL